MDKPSDADNDGIHILYHCDENSKYLFYLDKEECSDTRLNDSDCDGIPSELDCDVK